MTTNDFTTTQDIDQSSSNSIAKVLTRITCPDHAVVVFEQEDSVVAWCNGCGLKADLHYDEPLPEWLLTIYPAFPEGSALRRFRDMHDEMRLLTSDMV